MIVSPTFAGCVVSPGTIPLAHASVPSPLTAIARPFEAKIPGEKGPIETGEGADATPSRVTITFTVAVVPFGTISHGTCALICEFGSGFTNSIGALTVFESLTKLTLTPPRELDRGIVSAAAMR